MDVAQINLQGVSSNNSLNDKKDKSARISYSPISSVISGFGKNLNQTNIDLSDSQISDEENCVNFNIKFLKESERNLTLNGYYAKDYTSGEFSFNYKYLIPGTKDGKKSDRKFEVDFSLSFTSLNSISVQNSEQKEDIFDFLRRITGEIFSKINDGKTNITAIVLDPDDLKELAQIGDKKLVQLIYHLIEMIKLAIEAKKMTKKGNSAKGIVYHPHRIKNSVTETVQNNEITVNYSFSAKEIKNSTS